MSGVPISQEFNEFVECGTAKPLPRPIPSHPGRSEPTSLRLRPDQPRVRKRIIMKTSGHLKSLPPILGRNQGTERHLQLLMQPFDSIRATATNRRFC